MNRYPTSPFSLNWANVKFWLICAAIVWLLGAIGLGWLVNSIVILLSLLMLLPVIAFVGLRWWLKRNLVQAACPACQFEFAHLNHSDVRCPNCGEPLKVEAGQYVRFNAPNTIDVQAVEVSAQPLQD